MSRILIIRLSSLGDIIHTLPAFSVLRDRNPKSEIFWLVEKKGKDILDLVPGIDEIFILENKKKASAFLDVRKKIKKKDQVVLDFQGLMKSAFFAWVSGADRRIGFSRKNLRESAASLFYNDRLKPFPENVHVIDKNLKLLTKLGLEKTGDYRFPLVFPKEIQKQALKKLRETGIKKKQPFILINVGAAWESKRLFADQWICTVQRLSKEKTPIILLWGTGPEREIAETVSAAANVPAAPFLSIKEVMVWLEKASLLISGDTFALHAAGALNRPVVGLFGPTDPKRNGPINSKSRVIYHPTECGPCYKRKCASLDCMKKIQPGEILEASRSLLHG